MLGFPSCKQVSEQASLQLDENMPLLKRLGMKAHLLICDRCRRYVRQMKLTDRTIRYWMKGKSMPAEVRESLLKSFEQQQTHSCSSEQVKKKDS